MPNAFVTLLRVHQEIYDRSDGWVGHRLLFGMPSLLLRHVGRKTGAQRTSALTYGRDGDNYLVVASNGGASRSPAWLHNLTAQPDTEIQIGRTTVPVRARVVLPDDPGYERMWDTMNKVNHGNYRKYQEKTTRPIPVVELSPR